ncbi:MORN repeat-containing protein 5-like [Piliocolobus tephrosceles]|uniref:MORN repeat-containing protein 5-like n=1 Tax=Piliocolobus tephrosceles TaxID=591936 RepID=UPI000C2A52EF|nr:MORN repeat-containing protein 5-like [Piliocolobus tephrosceles]
MSKIIYSDNTRTKGKYVYPNGNVYIGEFKNSNFHGQGTLYIKGKGEYKGTWENGKNVEGEYYFSDGLRYDDHWDYLVNNRCLYKEEVKNVQVIYGEEEEEKTKDSYMHNIYDIGDGYCNTDDQVVYSFTSHKEIKKVNERERNWIKNHCAKC